MRMLPALLALSVCAGLSAQIPTAVPGFGLPGPELTAAVQAIAATVPFHRKAYSQSRLYAALSAKGANEDAQPLLPGEYLALPLAARAKALHPDTACLLVMRVCEEAARMRPEEARSEDWLLPVLIRAQGESHGSGMNMRGMNLGLKGTGGNTKVGNEKYAGQGFNYGPCCPLLEFRKNIPSPDPTVGLDQGSRIVELDRNTRNFQLQHAGKFAPLLYFCSDPEAKAEVQNWILARICVARAEGKWDNPERKKALLKVAASRVPGWDPELAERLRKCSDVLAAS